MVPRLSSDVSFRSGGAIMLMFGRSPRQDFKCKGPADCINAFAAMRPRYSEKSARTDEFIDGIIDAPRI